MSPREAPGDAAAVETALEDLDVRLSRYTETLRLLVSIPSVSAPGYPVEAVARGAAAVADALEAEGLEHVEILRSRGPHPYVYADHMRGGDVPTVLFYSHQDVQPAGHLLHELSGSDGPRASRS